MSELMYLAPAALRIHPQNMRRAYAQNEVDEMAASLRAASGNIQALLVVPDPEHPGAYLVVDGNLRLAAGRTLGDACPPFKCELIDAGHAQQLLIMSLTSIVYPKDPVSEGYHYRRLLREGYSADEIAEHTGINPKTVKDRIRLLDLETEIQELVSAGALPRDRRVADALLSIPDAEARIKLARRLASSRATIDGCVRASERLVEALRARESSAMPGAPALARTMTSHPAHASSAVRWGGSAHSVRGVAKATCRACSIHTENLSEVAEPAWSLISHVASDTCDACNLRELRTFCAECPAVELLRRLADAARTDEARTERAQPAPVPEGRRNGSGNLGAPKR
jgi:ParB/RepB/Spo0J family partition protein